MKSSISERTTKSLKSRITRYMTYTRNYIYTDKQKDFANSYDQTHHRTVDTEPANVTKLNKESVWLSTSLSKPN